MSTSTESANRPRRRLIPIALVLLVLIGSGAAMWAATSSSGPASHPGPEGVAIVSVPDLAPASTTLKGQNVGVITCRTESNQQIKDHRHVYVTVYVNGQQRRLPGGIGITQPWLVEHFAKGDFYEVGPYNCAYWIHTHTPDGIVHVEAPVKGLGPFTLGQFFTIWNQPLSANQVGPAKGHVTVYVNGRRHQGDPRTIPFTDLSTIQINVGTPVAPITPLKFHVTGLCGAGTSSCTASGK